MAIATFSVPIDIPWRRIAFSRDMMDKVACDRELPLRWNSSIAVFEYEPPEDQQPLGDYRVRYLKVACTITGYQPDGKEIRIRERLARSGWAPKEMTELKGALTDIVDKYHACYGAMLEVVVAPPPDAQVMLEDYPYFADFDPKKRELYELVTDTGEVMSRSLADVGVRLGQTTLQSHEVMDKTSLGVSLSPPQALGGPGASAGSELRTTDLKQRSTEDVRTSDASRESRETLSHTTQLSQMYHQLNSYHLGTNRAAFFVLPRPHVVQSDDPDGTPRTFVDGPRQLEGIQEFILVVVRLKSQDHLCVEAYLETAHLVRSPIYGPGTMVMLNLPKIESRQDDPGTPIPSRTEMGKGWSKFFFRKTGSQSFPLDGSTIAIDRLRGEDGHDIASSNTVGETHHAFDTADNHVTVRGTAVGYEHWKFGGGLRIEYSPASLELSATIYLKSGKIVGYNSDKLFITARAVCSCPTEINVSIPYEKNLSVVYEKQLRVGASEPSREREAMPIRQANRLSAEIRREMLELLSSADRYPRGIVGLLDTQLFAEAMGSAISDGGDIVNGALADSGDLDENVVRRVTAYSPAITRSLLLKMPLAQQVETFGLSFTEAVELRRGLTDIGEAKGPPPLLHRSQTVPQFIGMHLQEALAVVAATGLLLNEATEVDSPWPCGVVVAQRPDAGATVSSAMGISLDLASGVSVRLPDVVGLGLAEAACRVRDAGLRSEPTIQGQSSKDARVAALDPPAGVWVTPTLTWLYASSSEWMDNVRVRLDCHRLLI